MEAYQQEKDCMMKEFGNQSDILRNKSEEDKEELNLLLSQTKDQNLQLEKELEIVKSELNGMCHFLIF
jgi:hypothetical protein